MLRKENMSCSNCPKRKIPDQENIQNSFPELRSQSGPTDCQCEFKDGESNIFCERHQVIKTRSLHQLCKQRHDYFQLWEENRGPFQNLDPPPDKKKEKPKPLSKKSQGLGDTIQKIAEVTGIKTVVETVSKALGKDCGCEGRKEWLNSRVPYKPKKTKGFFE